MKRPPARGGGRWEVTPRPGDSLHARENTGRIFKEKIPDSFSKSVGRRASIASPSLQITHLFRKIVVAIPPMAVA